MEPGGRRGRLRAGQGCPSGGLALRDSRDVFKGLGTWDWERPLPGGADASMLCPMRMYMPLLQRAEAHSRARRLCREKACANRPVTT